MARAQALGNSSTARSLLIRRSWRPIRYTATELWWRTLTDIERRFARRPSRNAGACLGSCGQRSGLAHRRTSAGRRRREPHLQLRRPSHGSRRLWLTISTCGITNRWSW